MGGDIPEFVVDGTGLKGKNAKVEVVQVRKPSPNVFWEPIPNDMWYTISEKPGVVITVGNASTGITTSVCDIHEKRGLCTYETDKELNVDMGEVIFNLDATNNQCLTVNFGNIKDSNKINHRHLRIWFAGNRFRITDFSNWPQSVTACPHRYSDKTMKIHAGMYRPWIRFTDRGFANNLDV